MLFDFEFTFRHGLLGMIKCSNCTIAGIQYLSLLAMIMCVTAGLEFRVRKALICLVAEPVNPRGGGSAQATANSLCICSVVGAQCMGLAGC